jgi:predicted membrane metal-binding protein
LIEVLGVENKNFTATILIRKIKAIPKDVSKNIRNSGVAHILSLSGLHLSLIAMIFFVSSRAIN